ncbi:MAG: sulfatase-like hydrolase/transferase, partial [Chloroflexi bacterium]|nr:sulfatase-like hydrolase/transferase [Chloroflexota bacterium]
MQKSSESRPNIVLILADDMGYSDIGCYGSEIRTPNVDSLAEGGLRFTQMYNSARCCPSRAALLTGVNPQQAGVGHMVADLGWPAYQGYLNLSSVTIAEALKANGYATMMSGKWHVGGTYNLLDPASWTPGDATHPIPTQRGFDRFFGIITGAGSFYYPLTLMRDDQFIPLETDGFYFTNSISDNAVDMIEDAAQGDAPFFLHIAYTSPH